MIHPHHCFTHARTRTHMRTHARANYVAIMCDVCAATQTIASTNASDTNHRKHQLIDTLSVRLSPGINRKHRYSRILFMALNFDFTSTSLRQGFRKFYQLHFSLRFLIFYRAFSYFIAELALKLGIFCASLQKEHKI